MFRSRKNLRHYKKNHHKGGLCPFCQSKPDLVIEESSLGYVRRNEFPYTLWEMHAVSDHLMVLPKRHVAGLSDLTKEEQSDIIAFIAKYQSAGYNVYARGEANKLLSVPGHQHTHLIKLKPKGSWLTLSVRKPYLLINIGGER